MISCDRLKASRYKLEWTSSMHGKPNNATSAKGQGLVKTAASPQNHRNQISTKKQTAVSVATKKQQNAGKKPIGKGKKKKVLWGMSPIRDQFGAASNKKKKIKNVYKKSSNGTAFRNNERDSRITDAVNSSSFNGSSQTKDIETKSNILADDQISAESLQTLTGDSNGWTGKETNTNASKVVPRNDGHTSQMVCTSAGDETLFEKQYQQQNATTLVVTPDSLHEDDMECQNMSVVETDPSKELESGSSCDVNNFEMFAVSDDAVFVVETDSLMSMMCQEEVVVTETDSGIVRVCEEGDILTETDEGVVMTDNGLYEASHMNGLSDSRETQLTESEMFSSQDSKQDALKTEQNVVGIDSYTDEASGTCGAQNEFMTATLSVAVTETAICNAYQVCGMQDDAETEVTPSSAQDDGRRNTTQILVVAESAISHEASGDLKQSNVQGNRTGDRRVDNSDNEVQGIEKRKQSTSTNILDLSDNTSKVVTSVSVNTYSINQYEEGYWETW